MVFTLLARVPELLFSYTQHIQTKMDKRQNVCVAALTALSCFQADER